MNTLDILKYGNLTLLQSVEGLPDDAWETPGAVGVWSAKEIMAHIAYFELLLVEVLSTFVDGGATPTLDMMVQAGERFNELQVESRRGNTVSEILDEYKSAHQRVMELAGRISVEKFRENGTLPWYGKQYCLNDYIVYASYGHKREHSAHFGLYRDRLG